MYNKIGVILIAVLAITFTGCSNLHATLKKGDYATAKEMIKNKQGLDDKPSYMDYDATETALIKAIKDNQTEIASLMIESGANVNNAGTVPYSPPPYTQIIKVPFISPMQTAVLYDNKRVVEKLLPKTDLSLEENLDNSIFYAPPLYIAMAKNNVEITKMLLENGRSLKSNSWIPVINNTEILKLLEASKIDFKSSKALFGTNNLEVAKTMIMKSADINAVIDKDTGYTVAMYQIHNIDILETLLQSGKINSDAKDKDGWDLYTHAKYSNPKAVKLLEKYGVEDKLKIKCDLPEIPKGKALLIVRRPDLFAGSVRKGILSLKSGEKIEMSNNKTVMVLTNSGENELISKLDDSNEDLVDFGKIVKKVNLQDGNIYYLSYEMAAITGFEMRINEVPGAESASYTHLGMNASPNMKDVLKDLNKGNYQKIGF